MTDVTRERFATLRDQVRLFRGLSFLEMAQLLRHSTSRTFDHGEPITTEGNPGTRMYVLLGGRAVVMHSGAEGDEVIATLDAGHTVGEMSILGNVNRSAHVVAQGETTVFEIDKSILEECTPFLAGKLYRNLAEILAERLRFSNERAGSREIFARPVTDDEIPSLADEDWSGTDLRGLVANQACLAGAQLEGADLRGADLRGADLRGADLRGAQLADADLRGVEADGERSKNCDNVIRSSDSWARMAPGRRARPTSRPQERGGSSPRSILETGSYALNLPAPAFRR